MDVLLHNENGNVNKVNKFVFAISNRKTKTSELLLINILKLQSFS